MNAPDKLLDFIQQHTQAKHLDVHEYHQLSGGAIQENYGLHLDMRGGVLPGEHRFVVRMDAPSAISASLTRAEEFAVLQAVYSAGVPAPKPYWHCRDTSILGCEFYIMQWEAGSASAHDLVRDEALSDQQRRDLVFSLGQTMAQLHQLRPSTDTLSFLKVPQQGGAQARIAQCQAALDQLDEAYPAIALALRYLEQHAPAADHTSIRLCHGDFRTGNYLVKDGKLSALLDWEFSSWSDPYEDLGWFCSPSWRFGKPQREAGGIGDKQDLFAGYESVTKQSVDPEQVRYWELLASVRWAVIALQQVHRFLSGAEASLELALTGRMLPEIQLDILTQLYALTEHTVPLDVLSDKAGTNNSDEQSLNAPNADQLLMQARQVLLKTLLPQLPKDLTYPSLMVANAMRIAAREITQGKNAQHQEQQLLQTFANQHGLATLSCKQTLAHWIRQNQLTQVPFAKQLDVSYALVLNELTLSNPKKLPTP